MRPVFGVAVKEGSFNVNSFFSEKALEFSRPEGTGESLNSCFFGADSDIPFPGMEFFYWKTLRGKLSFSSLLLRFLFNLVLHSQ